MNTRFYQGHVARKRFGQNFLNDPFIIDSIVAAIRPCAGEAVVEIGPGLGALTEPMAAYLPQMTVIELDRDLAARLENQAALKGKLTIYQQDVMNINFNTLADIAQRPLRIFGNLPYNISTPLMFHLFNYRHAIHDMHFMLQKEVAQRLVAQPHNKTYGRLSVTAQYYCQIVPILEIPPTAFIPAPKVDSTLVRLLPYPQPQNSVNDINMLNKITMLAFNQRRKTIRNSLNKLFTATQLSELDINPTLRAENISVAQYCKLANWISAQSIRE